MRSAASSALLLIGVAPFSTGDGAFSKECMLGQELARLAVGIDAMATLSLWDGMKLDAHGFALLTALLCVRNVVPQEARVEYLTLLLRTLLVTVPNFQRGHVSGTVLALWPSGHALDESYADEAEYARIVQGMVREVSHVCTLALATRVHTCSAQARGTSQGRIDPPRYNYGHVRLQARSCGAAHYVGRVARRVRNHCGRVRPH